MAENPAFRNLLPPLFVCAAAFPGSEHPGTIACLQIACLQ
jgi:hypothetical protein